jgi:hypothetical protein
MSSSIGSSKVASDNVILEEFTSLVKRDVAVPVAAMNALVTVIKRSDAVIWCAICKLKII